MRVLGRTERRVVSAILITALIPLIATLFIGRTIIARISATAFQPEFGAHLDQSLGVYADLVKSIKQGMRAEADAIALSDSMRAAANGDKAAIDEALGAAMAEHASLAEIAVEDDAGAVIAKRGRDRPVDTAVERTWTVRRPFLGPDGAPPRILAATFATARTRFDEMEGAQAFAQAYHQIERNHRGEYLDDTYRGVLGSLLGLTIALAVAVGVLVVRPVTNRIARLAEATGPVASGDLSVRVVDPGRDEVADLGRAFNRMLEELERSRARIDFLRRIAEWQKMARHLAHEIKNPLTPIQLAVEECHRRCPEGDPEYKRIVNTTLEVVEEEIGTLRRLVSEFSSFARLPDAELGPADLGDFLRDQRDHFAVAERAESLPPDDERALVSHVRLAFELPGGPMPVALDRQMFHRVLVNVLRNAAQALRDASPRRGADGAAATTPWGTIRVSVDPDDGAYVVRIDDDGPGIDPAVRETMFDPYVTTKRDGTGLGLTIVKKIVVDHGGTIEASASPLGGARIEIRLPREGTAASRAALERNASAAPPRSYGASEAV